MKTIAVLRKDGHPFASKNNATTRMRALGLEDSHTVETYGDGYTIFPKALNEDRVTLQKGDYISTAGLSEDDYHAVVTAIESAGFNDYGCLGSSRLSRYKNLLIDEAGDLIGYDSGNQKNRQLTLSQILNATNAGGDAKPVAETKTEDDDMHLTDRLEAARTTLEAAQSEYDALLEEHKEAYPKLHGLIAKVDIPPEEWRAGDVVECINPGATRAPLYFTKGNHYLVVENDGSDSYKYLDDEKDDIWACNDGFRFIRRP